jgi:hypothetical protein
MRNYIEGLDDPADASYSYSYENHANMTLMERIEECAAEFGFVALSDAAGVNELDAIIILAVKAGL